MKYIIVCIGVLMLLNYTTQAKKYNFLIVSNEYFTWPKNENASLPITQNTWITLYYDSSKHRYEGDIAKDITTIIWHFVSYHDWIVKNDEFGKTYSIKGKLETATGILDIEIQILVYKEDKCNVTLGFSNGDLVVFDNAQINRKFTGYKKYQKY